jgi:hypothetical protein
MGPDDDIVSQTLTPEEESDSYTADEALATLAEMPPGIGFGAIINQTYGGLCLTVISTASEPLCPAYLMIAYNIDPRAEEVPEVETYVGYPQFDEFAACVRRAPITYPPKGWSRMDTLATYWIRLLKQGLEDEELVAEVVDLVMLDEPE